MVIYSFNLHEDRRLGCLFRNSLSNPLSPRYSPPEEDFFFVVHPDHTVTTVTKYKEYIDTTLKNVHCKGILFVSGSARCGLGLERVNKLQEQYKAKVRFLSYAVPTEEGVPEGYENRYTEFFCKIKNEDIIDWDLIDPTYPESIVAALLLLHVAPLCSEQPEEMETIWENAVAEYNSRSEDELDEEIDWSNQENIREQAKKLKKFLSDRQA